MDQPGQLVVGRIGTGETQTTCHCPAVEVGRFGHDSCRFRAIHGLGTASVRVGLCGGKAVLGRHDHHSQHALALHVSRERARPLRRVDVHHHCPPLAAAGLTSGTVLNRPPNFRVILIVGAFSFGGLDPVPTNSRTSRTEADRARTGRAAARHVPGTMPWPSFRRIGILSVHGGNVCVW